MAKKISLLLVIALVLTSLLPISMPVVQAAETTLPSAKIKSYEYNFDDGTTQGWSPRGSGVNVDISKEAAVSAPNSIKVTGRSSNWNGASFNALGKLDKNITYTMTANVKSVNASTTPSAISLTMQQKAAADDASTDYNQVASTGSINDRNWHEISGTYSFTEDMAEQTLYFESSDAVDTFYIDDITITPPGAGVKNIGFEDQRTQGFTSRLGGKVTVTEADSKNGTYSLLVSERENENDGPILDVSGKMLKGSKYNISTWLKLAPGPGNDQSGVIISMAYTIAGETKYVNLYGSVNKPKVITANQGWVNLNFDYIMAYGAEEVSLYIESKGDTASFYIDDFCVTYIPPSDIQTDIPSLKDVYQSYFEIGAAVVPGEYTGASGDLLKKHFNSMAARNDTMPRAILPDTFLALEDITEANLILDFSDYIKDYTEANDLKWRWHALVSDSQTPDWLFTDEIGDELTTTDENGDLVLKEKDPVKQAANKELVLNRMKAYIELIINRYGEYIDYYDVVNEVIDPSEPDGMRKSKWFVITGKDYIKVAFKTAKDELATKGYTGKLYINDYNTEDPAKRDFLYDLVQEVNKDEKLIDGVGHQSHLGRTQPSVSSIINSIKKFGDAGLDNQVTELDVSNYDDSTSDFADSTPDSDVPSEILIGQGHRYKQLFEGLKALDEEKDCISGVTIWGISDANTWLSTFPISRLERPLLFDTDQQAKYAYWGVVLANPDYSKYSDKLPNQEITSFATIPNISAGTEGSATYANAAEVIADLPTSVTANTSGGAISVPVNEWVDTDKYSTNIAGSYTFTAILGAIPDGYANTGNYTATVEVTIASRLDAEAPTITTQPQSMTVKIGETATLFVEAETASGTLNYQWYSNTTDTTTAGAINIATTSEAAIQVPTNTVGTIYYFCVITNTDESKPRTKTATAQSAIVPVTVAPNTYTLTYIAGANGSISGVANQTVVQGGSGSAVTAIPNNGYHFVDWSDGVKTATRTDSNVTGNIAVTARFAANSNPGGSTGGNTGGNSSGSTTTTPVTEPKPAQTGVVTLVNGKADTSATVTATKVDGKTVTTVTLDDKKIEERLKTESANSIITIQANSDSDVVIAKLNGETVKNMENKDAVLEIKTGNATYTLPVSQINIDRVAEQFGAQTDIKNITVNVTIADSSNDTAQIVQDIADKNHYKVVAKPVEFEITCTSGTKSVEVFKFNSYVERTIAIPDGIDPSKVTTAVVVNKDGTLSHVPTTIVSIDGKYYAKINSITNSTYTLIWNPVTFKDVENHWAESYVNEVGSRLIDSGVGDGNFAPNRAITRAEFAAMIVKALGLKGTNFPDKFSDVKKDDPYYYHIYTAYEYGILSGYSNGKFGTNDLITREQAMTMLANAMKIAGMDVSVSQEDTANQLKLFKDSGKISSYAKEGAAICIKNGIFGGNEGNITPKKSFTRAESATVVIKLLKKAKLI